MRPVKRSLKLLENPGDNLTETEHVEQTRQVWTDQRALSYMWSENSHPKSEAKDGGN